MPKFICFLSLLLILSCKNNEVQNLSRDTKEWESLFNGKDLSGWDIKITGHKLNDNYKNTFKIKDSMLIVDYSEYEKFDGKYGHLYSQKAYSHYILQMEYRFDGEHLKDAPEWADRNSGVMLHSQSGKSMNIDQAFPVSLEMQFLCSVGDTITTGNLCTPGTFVKIDGSVAEAHCISSNSKTYQKGEWVTAIAEVYGDSLIRHIINGDTVLTYTDLKIGEGFVNADMNWSSSGILDSLYWIGKKDTNLGSGHIALQAESQPLAFRNIRLLNLVGCMDKKAKNYKSYFVKHDVGECRF